MQVSWKGENRVRRRHRAAAGQGLHGQGERHPGHRQTLEQDTAARAWHGENEYSTGLLEIVHLVYIKAP
jgi:hypothetical protein